MNSKHFLESTTSGAIASVSTPVGKTQTRGKGVYPNEKGGNLLTGKKTSKKFANTVKESQETDEQEECPTCYGKGEEYGEACLRCGGKGYIVNEQGVMEGSDIVKSENIGGFKVVLAKVGFGYQVRIYYSDGQLFDTGFGTRDLEKGLLSFENTVNYMKKQLNVRDQGVTQESRENTGEPESREELYQYHLDAAKISNGKAKEHHLQQAKKYKKQGRADTAPTEFKGELDPKGRFTKDTVTKMFDKLSPDAKGVSEAQSMHTALNNALSKVETGSKLDKKIKHHNDIVRRGGKGIMDKAPEGYHIDKKGMIRLGVSEAKLDEEDVIIVPGQGNRTKPGFIPKAKDRTDHEVEMAKSDLFQATKNAKKIYQMIKDIPESQGIEGWVQEKIIKANDYLNTVREYLEHKQVDNVAEADKHSMLGKIQRGRELQKKVDSSFSDWGNAQKTGDKQKSRKAFNDHMRYANLEHPGTWTKVDEQDVEEGYRILPNIDRERYQEREGLEGPFRARNGKVYYYDAKAGMAYDPDTDFYIDYDDLRMMDQDTVEEGKVAGTVGALALLAALGINMPTGKDTPLGKELAMAARSGDQVAAYYLNNLDVYIDADDQRTLTNLKIAYIDDSDRPDVKNYLVNKAKENAGGRMRESSIMKGIQNEQSDDWGSMSKRDFKRREMQHELGDEDRQIRKTNKLSAPTKPKGMFFYNVPVGKENDARQAGLKQSKSGKWYGYRDDMFGKGKYWEPKNESVKENTDKCPECGGKLVAESELNEEGNKDACYHKVKSRYKVWPSAYASGALVKCRKVGASNWGNKSK